jgi:hypothetical protein
MHCNDNKKKRMKKAVGSVAQKAAEGADSLLSEARKDVVAARKPEPAMPKEVMEMAEAASKVKGSAETEAPKVAQENLKDTTKLVNSLSFATGGNKKMDKAYIMESLGAVADSPIVESKQSIAEFITDLHRTQIDEESKPLLAPADFKKLTSFASSEERVEKNEGGEVSDADKYISLREQMLESMDKAEDEKTKELIQKRWQQISDSFSGEDIYQALKKLDSQSEEREGKFLGGMTEQLKEGEKLLEEKDAGKIRAEGQDKEAEAPIGIAELEGPDPIEPSNNSQLASAAVAAPGTTTNIGYAEGGNVEDKMKVKYAEGGSMLDMPVDTYDNIPEDEKAAVEASQLPDDEMEDEYSVFVMEESLTEDDQKYLLNALEGDERLGEIFDKVMDVAGEFAGEGAVKGPGTGTSDSIPARLSDGEFVFTRKATDQIGTDKLQAMMDDAERAYDGGLMKKYMGGSILTNEEMEDPDKEVHDQMLGANAMPSVRRR